MNIEQDPIVGSFLAKVSQFENNLRQLEDQLGDASAVRIVRGAKRQYLALKESSANLVKRLEQLQGLVHTSALITSSLHLDQVLEEVMDTIIGITQAERAYLMLYSEEKQDFTIRAARNWDRASLSENEVIFSRNVVSLAVEGLRPILTFNAQTDDRFAAASSVHALELRSILCIPLLLHDQIIGVLYADNRVSAGVFHEAMLPLLTAFANQVAIAIENARLFEKVQADLDLAKREVHRLRIEIDQKRMEQEFTEITETEYFQGLERMVDELRAEFDDG
jgi:GAF domain-containing protein